MCFSIIGKRPVTPIQADRPRLNCQEPGNICVIIIKINRTRLRILVAVVLTSGRNDPRDRIGLGYGGLKIRSLFPYAIDQIGILSRADISGIFAIHKSIHYRIHTREPYAVGNGFVDYLYIQGRPGHIDADAKRLAWCMRIIRSRTIPDMIGTGHPCIVVI